ncbi:MAG: hypothetical protein EZS28_051288 [Streblomastix strix]|uniref:Uncharacterized protein n=1 Tax=Streblomastix strix TaxID=222440 RepID=A0A5J4T3Z4_9EUKA|nr:MAG: hypothetical protein EZS28_051288 [Streblomastix strix]
MPLIALGSATHLVEILRLNCSQFTVQRLSKPIHCLKAIATTSHIKLDARCTFVESSRLYSLKSPLSDCLPTVISAPTPAISLGGAESWEPEFFTHVRYPLPGYESKSIAVNIPYALLTALISPNLWNDTTYIPAIPVCRHDK